MSQPAQGPQDALQALERLYQKKAITLEEGKAAARLLARDDAYEFPAPRPEPAPTPAEPAAAPPAPSPAGRELPVDAAPSEEPASGGDGTSPG